MTDFDNITEDSSQMDTGIRKKKKKRSFFQKAKKFGKQGRFGKGRSIESDTYHYLLRVLETLNNQGFESPDEKSVFITNVFEQTEDSEVDICCNQLGSRVIETLLPEVDDFRVTERFMEALTKDMRVMMVDPFGSHVLEKLLFLCSFKGLPIDEDESFHYRSLWVLKVSKFAVNNFDFFSEDAYASHILKTVFQCLSGVTIPQSVHRSKYAIDQGVKVSSNKEYSFSKEGNEEFEDILNNAMDKVKNFEQLKDHVWDSPILSSVIQSLLYVLSKTDLTQCKELVKFLLESVFDKEDEFSFECIGLSQLLEMMISVTNEHLPKQFKKIYSRFLDGKLPTLLVDPQCSFLIQKLLNTCQDKERFEAWYENDFDHRISTIVESSQYQVLLSIAQACTRLSAKQSHFSVALMKALKIYDQTNSQNKLVHTLAYLGNESSGNDDQSERTINKPGSQIIQELLKFNKPIKTVTSLLSLTGIELRNIFSDPKGCYISGAFMSSKSIGEKSRDGLIKTLQGHFRLLCCNKFGSRSFDEIWKGSSPKGRDLIAAELSKEADLLKSNHFGKFIHNNLDLSTYKRNYEAWKSGISTKEKKRELFNDILGVKSEKDLKRELGNDDEKEEGGEKKKKRLSKKVAKSYLDDL